MNKITRMIGLGLASTVLATGLTVSTAGTASAFTRNEARFLDNVRSTSLNQHIGVSDRQLLNAGYYACDRQRHWKLSWQVGVTRLRIKDKIRHEINDAKFGGRKWTLSKRIEQNVNYNFSTMPTGGIC